MDLQVFGHQSPDTDSTGSPIIWSWYLKEKKGLSGFDNVTEKFQMVRDASSSITLITVLAPILIKSTPII